MAVAGLLGAGATVGLNINLKYIQTFQSIFGTGTCGNVAEQGFLLVPMGQKEVGKAKKAAGSKEL